MKSRIFSIFAAVRQSIPTVVKIRLLLYALLLCFVAFQAGAQTTHVVVKTKNIPLVFPDYEEGDTIRIIGDAVHYEDDESFRTLTKRYHLDFSTDQKELYLTFSTQHVLTLSAPYLEHIKQRWWLNYELKTFSLPKLRSSYDMIFEEHNSLQEVFCPSLEVIYDNIFEYYRPSLLALPNLKKTTLHFVPHSTLHTLLLPKLEILGPYSCWRTGELSSVYLPKTWRVSAFTFQNNHSLQSLYLPLAVEVEKYAFNDCGLETLFLPKVEMMESGSAAPEFTPSSLHLLYWETENPNIGTNTIIDRNQHPILLLTPHADTADLERMHFPKGSKALQTNRINPFDLFLVPGEELTIDVDIEGISNLQWHKDGEAIPNANSLSFRKEHVTAADGGLYVLSFTYDTNNNGRIDDVEHYRLAATTVVVGKQPTITGPSTLTIDAGEAITPIQFENNELESIQCAGILPSGLSFNSKTGVLSGTPSIAGKYTLWLHGDNDYSLHTGEPALHQLVINVIGERPPIEYAIQASAEEGGSIHPEGLIKIRHGESQTFTFAADYGYITDWVNIDGYDNNPEIVVAGTYTFEHVEKSHSILVSFRAGYYITSSASEGGTIYPNGVEKIVLGESQTYTFTPDNGFRIEQVLIDGEENREAAASGRYTFENVEEAHTIYVSFTANEPDPPLPTEYTIEASASEGGTIHPDGTTKVLSGESQTYTFTPDEGFYIDQVLIDDEDNRKAAASGSYTFENVEEDHTIAVSFIPEGSEPANPSSLLKSLSVDNGVMTPEFSPNNMNYTVYLDCGCSSPDIQYTTVSPTAVVDKEGELLFTEPGFHFMQIKVKDGEEEVVYNLEFSRPFDNAVVAIWNNVLSVINNPIHNGGYTFVDYSWYRDRTRSELILGKKEANLYLGDESNGLLYYHVWLVTSDGISAYGCHYSFDALSSSVRAYFNTSQQKLIVENYDQQLSRVEIFDMKGNLMKRMETHEVVSSVDVSNLMAGVYIVHVGSKSFIILKER